MNEMNTGAPQRPTMLTVICILSFIAGVWGLWGGVQSAFTDAPQREFEEAKVAMDEAMAQVGDQGNEMVTKMMDSAMVMAEKSVEQAVPMGYTNIALSLLSLFGVWLMWNLKKNGFWMYLVAAVGGLVAPMVFLGGGLLTLMGVGFMGLISVIFIILYAVNLKHMH
jgi:hypothetical protein